MDSRERTKWRARRKKGVDSPGKVEATSTQSQVIVLLSRRIGEYAIQAKLEFLVAIPIVRVELVEQIGR